MPIIAGQITGSILTASVDYTLLTSIPSGIISGAAQLPAGTVSSSGQIDYNSITNKLSNVVSSSAQVQPLLPGGTVSASGQVDITATTGYSTFSSSLATVDVGQTTRIDNLASLTSSYAINSTIQSQLANVVSSSTQVQPLLPGGTVSSSAQYPGWVTASSQIDYNSITNKLSDVVSSSAQVQPLLPAGTLSSSTQVNAILDADGVFSSSAQVVVQNTTGVEALATTGSNVFTANQTITGSLFVSENLTVLGSSSISYISQSTLNIGTNIITMNTNTPGTRLGGIEVIDSGSSPLRSGSLYFDSINDQWIFVHQNTAGGTTSSVVVMGPATFNNIGNETLLTQNRVLKGGGLEHISDSQITDNGVTVSITNGLSVGTNVSASGVNVSGLNASQIVSTDTNKNLTSTATTGTGNVVLAGSPTITGTLNAANITATGTMLLAGIISQSSQIDYNSITNKLSDVVSSSAQVQPLLPGGTVSSSAQYPGWVTASSQVSITGTTGYSTFSSSIATKNDLQDVSITALNAATSSYAINSTIQSQLAGVVSSSAQVKPLLPGGTVTSSAAGSVQGTIAINGADVNITTLQQASSPTFNALTITNAINASIVTASSLNANQAVFTNASDGLVSNAITGTGNVVMSASPTLTGTVVAANITANGTLLLQNIVSQSSSPSFTGLTSTGTVLLAGIYSSSAQTVTALSGQSVLFSGSQFSGIVSGSGLAYRLVVPVGTNQYAT